LVESFLEECPALMAEVRKSVHDANAVASAAAAHALKGAVCIFTEKAAFQTTVELETLARVGDLRYADRTLQKLELEMGRLVAALMMCPKPDAKKARSAAANSQP
jgi:HPt (histidine-containing phosphotransfer) domain-containing protein